VASSGPGLVGAGVDVLADRLVQRLGIAGAKDVQQLLMLSSDLVHVVVTVCVAWS
jgi:hypothetical protein